MLSWLPRRRARIESIQAEALIRLSQPAAEPQLPAEPAPDAPLRLGPRARRGAGEPLLKRSTPAAQSSASPEFAQSSASPEFAQSSASSATEEPGLLHRAGPWRLAGWAALGVGAPSLVAVAMVMLSPALRPPAPAPLERTDQATHPRAPSAAPAIPAADVTTALPGEPKAPLQIGEAAAPARPDFEEGMSAPPPATSPVAPPATETAADAERRTAEVVRKMDALSAQMDRVERSQPPLPPTEAAADEDRPVAAVERESDAHAAEVDRFERQWDSNSPEQTKLPASQPPAVAASPAPPSATSAVPTPASEAEANAERRMVEVERKISALFAEMDRAERHQDFAPHGGSRAQNGRAVRGNGSGRASPGLDLS